MSAADLQGPLDDFLRRTRHIKLVMALVEAASKQSHNLSTGHAGVDFSVLDGETENTANSMSLILLASSFEEFVREEIAQCAVYMSKCYLKLPPESRHKIRNAYWAASLDRLRLSPKILAKKGPKVPDLTIIGKVKSLLESIQGFVVAEDSAQLDAKVFAHHSNNFRPSVVKEIAERLGIKELISTAADSGKIKSYFGVTTKTAAAEKLSAKLDEFYDRRNETVHSLNGSTGYAVNVVVDYISIFEITAESIKNVLEKEIKLWPQ